MCSSDLRPCPDETELHRRACRDNFRTLLLDYICNVRAGRGMSLTDIELPSEYLRRCTLAWVMANTFCRRDVDQSWVLPLSLHEFVPQVIWCISFGRPFEKRVFLRWRPPCWVRLCGVKLSFWTASAVLRLSDWSARARQGQVASRWPAATLDTFSRSRPRVIDDQCSH